MSEPTCPDPGGCRSCPDYWGCRNLRVGYEVTTQEDEIAASRPRPYPEPIAAMVRWSELLPI